jgi:predicted metal-dependent HD superfamily phosphohydrolase
VDLRRRWLEAWAPLGQPPEHLLTQLMGRFDEYEMQVRREYAWVPETPYRSGRRKILSGFASRARVYCTEFFFQRYEARARTNLTRALARL